MGLPSDTPAPADGADDDLQFEIAEPAPQAVTAVTTAAARPCAGCGRPIASTYFAIGSKMVCADCAAKFGGAPTSSRSRRLGLATLYGVGAAVLGAIIWYVIRRVTNMEIGYVAILVGFMVGRAVLRGSGNRGGRAYQFLAVVLTYCSVAGNYAPDVVTAMLDGMHNRHAEVDASQPADLGVSTSAAAKRNVNGTADEVSRETAPRASATTKPALTIGRAFLALGVLIVLAIGVTLAAPFLGGTSNVIGLLIISFALWQAWKMNRARRLPVTGPYQIGQPTELGPVGGAV